jgi:lysophospholipase L1-like esterase
VNASLVAAKLALGAVLLPQARWLKRTALRLPEAAGPRDGVEGEGATQLRLLVVGDSSAAGVGVADQAQALAMPLAQQLARRLGGAVSWQLAAQTGINTAQARDWIGRLPLQKADVIVTALGVNDVSSQTSAKRFVQDTASLWSDLRKHTCARWGVVSGLPPMHMLTAVPHPLRWYLGRYATWLDGAVREWAGQQRLGYLALQWANDSSCLAEDGFHPGPALYPRWAERLADVIVAHQLSVCPSHSSVRPEPVEGPR